MTPGERDRWSRIRQRGLARFLVWHGAFRWGLTAGSVWLLALTAFRGAVTVEAIDLPELGRRALIALAVFPPIGVLWALRLWAAMERRYREDTAGGPS